MSDSFQLDYSLGNPNGDLHVEIINILKQELGIPVRHELLGDLPIEQTENGQELLRMLKNSLKTELQTTVKSREHDEDSTHDDNALPIKKAAQILNLAKQTIYGMTSRREIPFCKKGKRLYFKKSELLEWIEEGRKKSKVEITKEATTYLRKNK